MTRELPAPASVLPDDVLVAFRSVQREWAGWALDPAMNGSPDELLRASLLAASSYVDGSRAGHRSVVVTADGRLFAYYVRDMLEVAAAGVGLPVPEVAEIQTITETSWQLLW